MKSTTTPFAFDARLERASTLSRYLKHLVAAEPHLIEALQATIDAPWNAQEMEANLSGWPVTDEGSLKCALRTLRKQVMLRLIVRDLNGLASLMEVMATATSLAEISLRHALAQLRHWLGQTYGTPRNAQGEAQELMVIGMGKLGGAELNVSSDIDLIFVYPEDGATDGARSISNHEFFTLLGKKLIAALHEVTADGFVFRVDMRLRPYGDSGALVVSLAMLEQYLVTQGRAWERYAWIKARVVAGTRANELLELSRPFVFRKYLDFGALAELRKLHAQIREEVKRRELSSNIKLGPGGIREIEFIAQVFQIIRGGRERALQAIPTLTVLPLLMQRQLLPAQVVAELTQAYVFLRNLEHRLQYLDDAQTQTLPDKTGDQALIAEAMGFADWNAFMHILQQHRARVTRQFESVFAQAPDHQDPNRNALLWQADTPSAEACQVLSQLNYAEPEAVLQQLQALRQGNHYRRLPDASRIKVDALIPQVVATAAQHGTPEKTLSRMLDLLQAIDRREAYLALLTEYPMVLDRLARLVAVSAWAADYLRQHPLLLDELLDLHTLLTAPDWPQLANELSAELALASGDIERQMDLLRHFKQAQVFRLLAQDLEGLWSVEHLSDHLSDLADLLLETTLRICWQNLGRTDAPRFAVIGYGKLGSKELGYASDLDLIFLFDDAADGALELYSRLARRLLTWLTTFTPAGILYETDMRLRPDGEGGLIVRSVAGFESYQTQQAWVWEHQALTRARLCAGDHAIGQMFEHIRSEILRRPRDGAALQQEIATMREKMRAAQPNSSGLFDLKHDAGGIIDVEFIVQYLVLAHACAHPELTRNAGNIALLKLAGELGLISAYLATAVGEAYREFRRRQHLSRLNDEKHARVPIAEVENHVTAVRQLWDLVLSGQA